MSDKAITAQEINRIIELTLPHRDRIVKDIAKAFPGREAHALGLPVRYVDDQ